jgi:hypothetical protein
MSARIGTALLFAMLATVPACRPTVDTVPAPVALAAPDRPSDPPIPLPRADGSLKFAVIGDFGTGEEASYQLADRLWRFHQDFELDLVITVGDNLYGSERPQDFERKFEIPYKPLLDDGVEFRASLGNHDSREQRFYEPFNLDGKLYYSFKAPKENVRFFVLDSTYPVPEQIAWLERELEQSNEPWKIAYFHHPLYSSGERHGSHVPLRQTLEPLFVEHGVSVVFTGHDHFYERIEPQKGIVHFVVGSGGKLRVGNIERATGITARGFDGDQAFMAVEIKGDRMYFQAVTRTGEIVDSGIVERRKRPGEAGE